MVFHGLEHHAIEINHIPRLVLFFLLLEVDHVKLDMNALCILPGKLHEIGPHRQGVALEHQKVFSVVQFLTEGLDVADLVLGNDILLAG